MKLAICFFGQPRFLDNEMVYEKYRHLMDQYDVDVYVHSWIGGTTQSMMVSDWAKQYNIEEQLESSSKILSMYNPVTYRFDAPMAQTLSQEVRQRVVSMPYWSENNERNLLSHLKSYSESIRLVSEPDRYDFILMTRFDAFLFDFPDLQTLDPSRFYLAGRYRGCWSDVVQLSGPKFTKAFDVYSAFDHITNRLINTNQNFTAEAYKRENYTMNYSHDDVRWIDGLSVGLVRSNVGVSHIQV